MLTRKSSEKSRAPTVHLRHHGRHVLVMATDVHRDCTVGVISSYESSITRPLVFWAVLIHRHSDLYYFNFDRLVLRLLRYQVC